MAKTGLSRNCVVIQLLLLSITAQAAPQYSYYIWYPAGLNGGQPYTRSASQVWSNINSELLTWFYPSSGTVTRHWYVTSATATWDSIQFRLETPEYNHYTNAIVGGCSGARYFDVYEEMLAAVGTNSAPNCRNFKMVLEPHDPPRATFVIAVTRRARTGTTLQFDLPCFHMIRYDCCAVMPKLLRRSPAT
jgi:hypothetical protein